MAIILNIETATSVCSVSLCRNGEILFLKESKKGFNHASLLTVFIEKILKEAHMKSTDFDAVAISKGPGSYTGLRIGVATAKGLCYAASLPLIAINTLQAMAYFISSFTKKSFNNNVLYGPMIDARRMEVYSAIFNANNQMIKKTSADIITKDSYAHLLMKNRIIFFGSGAEKCTSVITHPNAEFLHNVDASAAYMGQLSKYYYKKQKFEDLAYFEPFYLKDFIATQPKKRML